MNKFLENINLDIESLNGKMFFIGGYVRDLLLGLKNKDIDIEVFNIEYDTLISILSKYGKVNEVGKSFGIIKVNVDDIEYDFSIPRTENKNGIGHLSFKVSCDPKLSMSKASERRDFTINSIFMNIKGEITDFHYGAIDINNKILHPVSEQFKDDVLRPIRAFQFASRFDMKASTQLCEYSQDIKKEYNTLSKERIWCEWEKWALKSIKPSKGIELLEDIGWLDLYPELYGMKDIKQDAQWHPEGKVLTHTKHVCDHMAFVCDRDNIVGEDRLVLMFSALCHDMGKITHTKYENGRIKSKGHEQASESFAISFLNSIDCPKKIIDRVVKLVVNHMIGHVELTNKAIRRLSYRLYPESISNLVLLCESDQCGRPPLPKVIHQNLINTIEKAKKLDVINGKPRSLIKGQDLIDLGYEPGIEFGKLLQKLYEMQLKGSFFTKEKGLSLIKGINLP